jgi:hypothetical protein
MRPARQDSGMDTVGYYKRPFGVHRLSIPTSLNLTPTRLGSTRSEKGFTGSVRSFTTTSNLRQLFLPTLPLHGSVVRSIHHVSISPAMYLPVSIPLEHWPRLHHWPGQQALCTQQGSDALGEIPTPSNRSRSVLAI